MASSNGSNGALTHYTLTPARDWPAGWYHLTVQRGTYRAEHYLRGRRDAERYLAAEYPEAIAVPRAWHAAPIDAESAEVRP